MNVLSMMSLYYEVLVKVVMKSRSFKRQESISFGHTNRHKISTRKDGREFAIANEFEEGVNKSYVRFFE